jgi:hypothetical protein
MTTATASVAKSDRKRAAHIASLKHVARGSAHHPTNHSFKMSRRTPAASNGKLPAAFRPPFELGYEVVAVRAYFIWQANGCPWNCDEDHWFQAELELKEERRVV